MSYTKGYTKGNRSVMCVHSCWISYLISNNEIIGKFNSKADAELDASAPELYKVLKETQAALNTVDALIKAEDK